MADGAGRASGERPAFDPAAEGWSFVPESGFVGLVGPIWSRQEGGAVRYGFLAEAKHANLIGVVQGGMVMTFADRGLGMMAWDAAGGRPSVTASFETLFVGAGRIGSFLTLSGEVVRRTRSLVFMRGLVASGGEPVATCQGIWKILSARRAPGATGRPAEAGLPGAAGPSGAAGPPGSRSGSDAGA